LIITTLITFKSVLLPLSIPLLDEEVYFKYRGLFSLEFLLPELYTLDTPTPEQIFNLTNYSIIEGVELFEGYLNIYVRRNYIDYVTFELKIEPISRLSRSKLDLFELGVLKREGYIFNVSRRYGLISRGNHSLPFLFIWDKDSIKDTIERFGAAFLVKTNDGYNFSVYDLTFKADDSRIQLMGKYSVYMLPKINNRTVLQTILPTVNRDVLVTYSQRGYAKEYRFYITPLILYGIGIYFEGILIDTNLSEENRGFDLAKSLHIVRYIFIDKLGPLGDIIFTIFLILLISSVSSLVMTFLKRIRK